MKKGSQCKVQLCLLVNRWDYNYKSKKSRNHTELLCKHLKLPITIKKNKNRDEIKIKKVKKLMQ